MSQHNVSECLATLKVSVEDLEACGTLQLEFAVIKRAYFKLVLKCHPDKGGDAAVFRTVHASFEALRTMYDNKKVKDSFVTSGSTTMNEATWQEFADMPTQSWDFYYEAAEEDMPSYRVELAKSGRSKCKQTSKIGKKCGADTSIGQGEIRCGSLDDESGGYGRWHHLKCWRVPAKVWLGIPDPDECDDTELFAKALLGMNEVLLSGFSELPDDDKEAFVEHVMDKDNWARWQNRKPKKNDAAIAPTGAAAGGNSKDLVSEGYHQKREQFVVPVPGKNGSVAGALAGKTVVLTGTFPEVGGGRGLSLGKDRVKAMIESFGGRVMGTVSGRTDLLIVGKDPGASKVSKGEASKRCKLISLKDLKEVTEGASIEDVAAKPVYITGFSAGYGGNGVWAITTTANNPVVIKNTVDSPQDGDKKPAAKRKSLEDDGGKKPAPKKRKGTKAAAKKKGSKKSKPEEKENVSDDEGNVKSSDDEEEEIQKFAITCDNCGASCTKQSWHVEETEEDFCINCHDGSGVEQCEGINV